MGCNSSKVALDCDTSASNSAIVSTKEDLLQYDSKWRVKLSKSASKREFIADGTLPKNASDSLVALRMFLEDHASIIRFAECAKRKKKIDLLVCWIEVLEYKVIGKGNGYKVSKAIHLYHKYFKEDAVIQLPLLQKSISEDVRFIVADEISMAERDFNYSIPVDLFDTFGHLCLMQIHDQIYLDFKSSMMYMMTLRMLTNNINHVELGDFDYMDLLGEGAFGMVVHCRKKSTGKHYAMKIQTKVGLIDCFADDPKRVTHEKEALAKCHHPFIISMDYAFQTPELAIMVTSLGTGQSLSQCKKIPEERVRFYAAEMVLALIHIHSMEMIYRDLKPSNVLLNADGHIQLVDMGGVVDVGGKTLGRQGYKGSEDDALFDNGSPGSERQSMTSSSMNNVKNANIVKNMLSSASNELSASLSKFRSPSGQDRDYAVAEPPTLKRARSIMGTAGYMAPEMLAMLVRSGSGSVMEGYTNAVDYWSLGVTIYVLLFGALPFHHEKVAGFVRYIEQHSVDNKKAVGPPDYARWFDKVNRSVANMQMSDDCKGILTGLLCIDEGKRLGAGNNGVKNLKTHPWFKNISWNLLAQKLMKPPFVQGSTTDGSLFLETGESVHSDVTATYSSFSDMMADNGSEEIKYQVSLGPPNECFQTYFRTWDFVAPSALKIEMCAEEQTQIAAKLEQHEFVNPQAQERRLLSTVSSVISYNSVFRDTLHENDSTVTPGISRGNSVNNLTPRISRGNSMNNLHTAASPSTQSYNSPWVKQSGGKSTSIPESFSPISSFYQRLSSNALDIGPPTPSAAHFGTTKDAATIASVVNVLTIMDNEDS